jgi:antitoxin (DNA-binding transcriptional repressor) of toxin-antitoxin stability system
MKCNWCHFASVKAISIKQLHAETGRWVRAASRQTIVVTDRGQRIAMIQPFPKEDERPVFRGRDWSKLPKVDADSTKFISEERDRW